MANEIRVSPDGKSVAIASDHPTGAPAAGYGVFHAVNGGYWENNVDRLADWPVLTVPDLPAPAEIEAPVPPDPEFESASH